MRSDKKRIVILGAGYAGVRVARDLARQHNPVLEIILVNDSRFHIDVTTFYEVASAFLEQESTWSSEKVTDIVAVDLAEIFAGLPVTCLVKVAKYLHPAERTITFSDNTTLSYDTLVITLGAHVATYGVRGLQSAAFSVKTLHESLELRSHLVRQFHMARKQPLSPAALLTFVVVGAGPAGVETAAELVGHIRQQCHKMDIDPAHVQIILAEAAPAILRTVPPAIQQATQQRLEKIGVKVLTGQPITEIYADHVVFKNGKTLATNTVIWTGGLRCHPVLAASGLPLAQWGIKAEATLQVVEHPDIYVAGDSAIIASSPVPIPAIVPVAYTQGALVARNILNTINSKPLQTYQYRTLGALIALGGKHALFMMTPQRGYSGIIPWIIKKIVMLRYWTGYLPLPRSLAFWWHSVHMQRRND